MSSTTPTTSTTSTTPTRSALAALALAVLMSLAGTSARADATSLVALGVGGGVGVRNTSDVLGGGGPSTTTFVNQANLRLSLGQVLGLDYSMDLSHDRGLGQPAAELQYAARMRLSALVYPYAGEHVAFYLAGGVGATSLGELIALGGPGLSLQAGAGFELRVADHLAIDVSFMLLAPGPRSIERAAVARLEAAYAAGGADAVRHVDTPGLDDVVSLRNHEIMVRLFLFL